MIKVYLLNKQLRSGLGIQDCSANNELKSLCDHSIKQIADQTDLDIFMTIT